jgi:hypothetical protein
MQAFQYQYLVREEQNKELMKEAAYERWRHSLGPQRTTQERLGQRLVRQASEWLERRERPLPCNPSVPACGLTLAS